MSKVVLGKGLSALIPGDDAADAKRVRYRMVPVDEIGPNPMQPRHDFDPKGLEDLAESFKKNGIIQPLVVKKNATGYVIIVGERRYRAARLAQMTEVPAVVVDECDNVHMLELALVENIHRQDLNPIEAALACRRLIDECGLTQNDVAARLGRSRAAIANQLRLLSLPVRIQELIREGRLTEGHARAILAVDGEQKMIELAEKIVADSLSVREVEHQARRAKRRRLIPRRVGPALGEMESYLKRLLGTAVRITPGLKKGRIEIEYYGESDLERLWELFRKIDG